MLQAFLIQRSTVLPCPAQSICCSSEVVATVAGALDKDIQGHSLHFARTELATLRRQPSGWRNPRWAWAPVNAVNLQQIKHRRSHHISSLSCVILFCLQDGGSWRVYKKPPHSSAEKGCVTMCNLHELLASPETLFCSFSSSREPHAHPLRARGTSFSRERLQVDSIYCGCSGNQKSHVCLVFS